MKEFIRLPLRLFLCTLSVGALVTQGLRGQEQEKEPPKLGSDSKTVAKPEGGTEPEEEEAEEPPPALTVYKGRTIAQTMHWLGAEWLLRQEREREEATSVMMRELGLKPGMVVCDMGSGNGYHSLMMAKKVGEEGKVVAVDIQPEMLRLLKARARAAGLENIETTESAVHDPKLPPNTFDFILLVDVYHEFSHPEQMLAGMLQSLKNDGQIVLVEFRMEDPEVPIKRLHKMSKAQIMKELPPNGFKLTRSFDDLPWQHLMFFGREDGKEATPSAKDEKSGAKGGDEEVSGAKEN